MMSPAVEQALLVLSQVIVAVPHDRRVVSSTHDGDGGGGGTVNRAEGLQESAVDGNDPAAVALPELLLLLLLPLPQNSLRALPFAPPFSPWVGRPRRCCSLSSATAAVAVALAAAGGPPERHLMDVRERG